MTFNAITLTGKHVRLEPLSEAHIDGIRTAIADGELWKLHVTRVPHPDHVPQFIQDAIDANAAGTELAFATMDNASGKMVGSTRFMRFEAGHQRVEIGFTFLAASWQRTKINTEAKLLMLTHAFDQLQLNRVEFLTDFLNQQSRAAILRLGAREEGILRNHMVMRDGRVRDSVMHSILQSEWRGVRQHLEAKLAG